MFTRIIVCLALALTRSVTAAAADPVDDFRASADSLYRAGADDALTRLVADRAILVGALVGTLLDDAFVAAQAGDGDAEKERLTLAQRVAEIHAQTGGSTVPRAGIERYRSWTPEERQVKASAADLEKQADIAREFRAYVKAVELLEQARGLYEQIGDQRAIAVNYGSLGVAHWYLAEMEAVRENYEKALEARRLIEDRILEGKTLNGLGSTNLRTGNYDSAVEFYQQAIALRRSTGDAAGLGTSLTYLGNCYYQMNRLVDARNHFEEALPILERVGEAGLMMEILNSVANLYSDMNRLRAANDAYRRAIDIALGADSPADEATCRINLAGNLQSAGKYTEALSQLELAAERLVESPEPFRQANLYRTRASVWVDIGELDNAREDLMKLLQQAEGLGDPFYWVDAQLMTAAVYLALGANDRALGAAEKAIAAARRQEMFRLERAGEGVAARIQTSDGKYESALSHWRAALALSEGDESIHEIVEAKLGIAGVLALMGERTEARALYREHIEIATENGLLANLSVAHMGIAHTFEEEDPDSATFHYDQALAVYEQSLQQLGTGSEFLSGNRRYVYEEVARYYTRLYANGGGEQWSKRAFKTVESAKARGLLGQLQQAAAFETTPAEEALLDSMYTLAAHHPDDSAARDKVEREYQAVRAQRVSRSTVAIEESDQLSDLETVCAGLGKDVVMLSYALGDTASLMWVMDEDGSELFTIANRDEIQGTVGQLRDAIRRPDAGDTALRTSARALYRMLIEPVESRVKKAERLVIAPDGVLFELPFETLLARDAGEGEGWKKLAFLGKQMPIVYVPSASVFAALKGADEGSDYDVDLVAFGDPDYTVDSGLARLPYTSDEVATISASIEEKRKRVYLGADASESRLKAIMLATHPRILHLAAHGLVDANDPSASSIALCEPLGDGEEGEDGLLHTMEIAAMRLNAGLVVLSACESARGRVSRSEGVVGLSRAFLASGAHGVVASLWSVSDESTAELMKEMYRRMLGNKEPAATALHEARLALLDSSEYSHPFHWAPFIAIGTDTSPW